MKKILFLTLLTASLVAQGQNINNATIYSGPISPTDNHYLISTLNGQLRRIPPYRIGQERSDSLATAMATYVKIGRMLDSLSAIRSALAGVQAGGDYATNAALTSGLATKQNAGDYATNTALATGLATKADLVGGKVSASQLPSYVDNISEYTNRASFPATGLSGTIYVAQDTKVQYRWGGTDYYNITSGAVSMVNSKTGNVTLTKSDIGMDSVPNVNATNPSNITQSANYRFTTDAEKAAWNAKQPAGDYATNTALTNGLATKQPIGDYATNGALTSGLATKQAVGDYATNTALTNGLSGKQNTLISGTSIKTVNGNSLLGSGDLVISGSGGSGDVTNSTLSGLRALVSASSAVRYYITDSGKEGLFYYDALDNTSEDDGALCLVGNAGKRYKRVLENNTVHLKWFSGASDYSPILSKLWAAGYKVEGEFGSTYPITSILTLSDKNIYFNGNGSTLEFTYTGSARTAWLVAENSAGTSYTVDSLKDWQNGGTSLSYDTWTNIGLGGLHGSSYVVLSGNMTSVFPLGTVCKMYSTTEYITGFTNTQKADYFTVEAVAYDATSGKTRIAFQGAPLYTYTITSGNLKLIALKKNRVELRNFTFRHMNQKVIGALDLTGLVNPIVENVRFENLYLATVELRSTYAARIKDCYFANVQNQPDEGFGPSSADAGYGVGVSSDALTIVEGCHFSNIRHGVTTGNWTNSTNVTTTDPWNIGETQGLLVSGNTAKGMAQAFDTHMQGTNITYQGNVIDGSSGAFQIRSRGTRLISNTVMRCLTAVYIDIDNAFTPDPIIIDGLTVYQTHGDIQNCFKISNSVAHPVIMRNSFIKGGYAELINADIEIANCEFDTRRQSGGTEIGRCIHANGSTVKIYNSRFKSSNSSFGAIWFAGTNSSVYVDGLAIEAYSDATPELANGNTATTATLVAKNVTFLGANGPSYTTTTFPVANTDKFSTLRVQFKHESLSTTTSNKNSNYFNLTGSGAVNIDNIVKYVLDENIFVKANISAAASIASFPAQGCFAGQRITIQNVSAFTLTLPTLSNGAKSLTQWQSATIVWTSTEWIYV